MGHMGKAIAAAGQTSIRYGEAMMKDVTPQMAARKPSPGGKVIDCNHPAWVYGHLALYSSRLCELAGIEPGPTAKPAGWDELFKNGTSCLDDPSGTIYPPIEQLQQHYLNGYRHVLAKIAEVSDDALNKPNPAGGRMTELFPTVGAMAVFMLVGHPMSHLGQVSTWRRAMGLGSAM
jgi:hypothetical protein